MKITNISNTSFGKATPQKKFNTVKATGYGALVSGIACALTPKKQKYHRFFALSALILSIAHIGILESYKIKRKSDK